MMGGSLEFKWESSRQVVEKKCHFYTS